MMITLLTFILGGLVGGLMPAATVLKASGEIVSFVSLLMAGLLPAMILTATVLRGDQFSSSRVRSFGFWATLFCFALISVFFITGAKILDDISIPGFSIFGISLDDPGSALARIFVSTATGFLFLLLRQLWPAYRGLRSVLELSVQMAELQAISNDRTLEEAFKAKIGRMQDIPTPSKADWPT
jgi:hypothetical protein